MERRGSSLSVHNPLRCAMADKNAGLRAASARRPTAARRCFCSAVFAFLAMVPVAAAAFVMLLCTEKDGFLEAAVQQPGVTVSSLWLIMQAARIARGADGATPFELAYAAAAPPWESHAIAEGVLNRLSGCELTCGEDTWRAAAIAAEACLALRSSCSPASALETVQRAIERASAEYGDGPPAEGAQSGLARLQVLEGQVLELLHLG